MREEEALQAGKALLAEHVDWLDNARENPNMELRVVRVLVYQGPVDGVLAQLGRSLSPGERENGTRGTITVVQGPMELVAAREPAPHVQRELHTLLRESDGE